MLNFDGDIRGKRQVWTNHHSTTYSSGGSRVSQTRDVGEANLFLAIFFKILYENETDKVKREGEGGSSSPSPLNPPMMLGRNWRNDRLIFVSFRRQAPNIVIVLFLLQSVPSIYQWFNTPETMNAASKKLLDHFNCKEVQKWMFFISKFIFWV